MRLRLRLKTVSIAASLLFLVVLLATAVSRILSFISLFHEHSGIAITQAEIARAHDASGSDTHPQVIPKITHQIFHNWRQPGNDTLPPDWAEARQTCIDQNPGWKHMLWTEKASRDFIATEYAWFLNTYDGYRFPVQRVDALRYFLMLHYGGIYIDLDNGCLTNLDPLLAYPVWLIDSGRGTLSNNILGARPNHPFWNLLTQSLHAYAYDYVFPYLTISYASGHWFEAEIWEKYHAMLPAADKAGGQENRLYRVIMDDRKPGEWLFFSRGRGGTWSNWDNGLFLWVGEHLGLLVLGASIVAGLVGWGLFRAVRKRRAGRWGYRRLDGRADKDEEDLAQGF